MSPPSRLQIRQEIKKLNRLDPRRALYSSINSTYTAITEGLRVVVGMAGGGELFYRVRRVKGAKPTRVVELQAPSPELVTGYQRCNPPRVPMFYAASQRKGALVEARVEAGEVVYLSQWIGRDRIPVNRIFDSDETQIGPGHSLSTIHGPNDDIILAYFDTLFTKRIHSTFSDDYKFTAAIAQQLTTKFPYNELHDIHNDGFVALKYPSVLGTDTFHNTAMHASFASERLEILHAMEICIHKADEKSTLVDILDTAIHFDDGNIHWSGNPNHIPEILGATRSVPFIFDGSRWNLKLHDGVITPEYIKLLMED